MYDLEFLPRIPEIRDERLKRVHLIHEQGVYKNSRERGHKLGADYLKDYLKQFFHDSPKIVLDIGCGIGTHTIKYAKAYPQVPFIGLDIDDDAILYARGFVEEEGIKNLEFVVGDTHQLGTNFKDMHLIRARYTLHELNLLEEALSQIYTSLMAGGLFCFEDFNREYIQDSYQLKKFHENRSRFLEEEIAEWFLAPVKGDEKLIYSRSLELLKMISIFASYTPLEIEEQLQKVGFKSYQIENSYNIDSYVGYAIK